MLKEVLLKFGEEPGAQPLRIRPGAMTVLVGPNNSGKSLTLRELKTFIATPRTNNPTVPFRIVANIIPRLPVDGDLLNAILADVESDIAPFRSALSKVQITPKELIESFDPSHIGKVLAQVTQFERLLILAKQHKIDPSLAAFDSTKLASQPTIAKLAAELLRQLTTYIGRNADTIEHISDKQATLDAVGLVDAGVVWMDGYLGHFNDHTVLLDGQHRLRLTDPQKTHRLFDPARNMMMRLFQNPSELERLREYTHQAFRRYLAIDATGMRKLRFVLADEPPGDREHAIASAAAMDYFSKAEELASLSDGVKSYVGLHATLLSRDDKVILVDEPEAFLHPPLARKLGYNLATLAAERGASVFAATHSPFFLMGCIEAGHDTNVVRLGFNSGVPTARMLPADRLGEMMNDPLLRSTGVLNALFHHAAIVCEGDSDRAFYEEINERLRIAGDSGYARDCCFIHVYGKWNVPKLLGALRSMGIAAVGIVDLDVLKDRLPGELLEAAGASPALSNSIGSLKGEVFKTFELEARRLLQADSQTITEKQVKDKTSELIKGGGIRNLSDVKARSGLKHFLRDLATYGVFVPEFGALEQWLPELSAGIGKSGWLEAMFERLGSFGGANYVVPGDGDVWDFIRSIGVWIEQHRVQVLRRDDPISEEDSAPVLGQSS